ncbi:MULTISPECIES: hypothetical protein [Bradyrhizobium]|jgi:hypothetical protein|uniref:hypothetical protein n=1 Tax=Bradyrhizobium TaxID=374 RepID=UPI0004679F91|nr:MULTISPECIES: hypothetical protein [Bradyrhizobium]KIU51046.1 hypothetical protein QU41_06425 [Bradyrhizobium elkanii]OCX28121.1 hypothetical protein QU42_23820 [Bradyrhizobium sp. UASWS1016]
MPHVTMADAMNKVDGSTLKAGSMRHELFDSIDNQAPIAAWIIFNETVAIYRAVQCNPPFAPLCKQYK